MHFYIHLTSHKLGSFHETLPHDTLYTFCPLGHPNWDKQVLFERDGI